MNVSSLKDLGRETGLMQDSGSGWLFGYLRGYHVCVVPDPNRNACRLVFSVSRGGRAPTGEELQPLEKGCAVIESCTVDRYRLTVTTKANILIKKALETVKQALNETLYYLGSNGFTDCCQSCGRPDGVYSFSVAGGPAHLCGPCYEAAARQLAQTRSIEEQKPENPVAGAVGALLGSLVGALAIILISRLGFVAAISGVIMAVTTLKGYELLGGKLSTKGMIISAVLMVVMVYLANRADWAISVYQEFKSYGADFFQCFRIVPELLKDADLTGRYIGSLVLVYLFTALGAVPQFLRSRQNKVNAGKAYPLHYNG